MTSILDRRDKTPIFGAVAADYFAKGLSVIPLVYHEKRPIPNDWSRFADAQPTEQEQRSWIAQYSNCNVGLVLGKQSNVTGIDIDLDLATEENQKIVHLIQLALPKSPWVRIGKKGMVMAYKFSGVPTFRIKDSNGKTLVEYLSTRTQFVLPPSIHPDTQQPYKANCNLLDVLDQLPSLPQNVEHIIRQILKDNGIELSVTGRTRVTDWVPAGSRDTKMVQVAGTFAAGVMRGERPLLEAIELLRGWHTSRVEDVAGDPLDVEKGVERLVTFVLNDVKVRGKLLPLGWDDGLTEEDKTKMGLNFDEDQQEWTFDQIKDYVRLGFESQAEGTAGRGAIVEKALVKIAHNKSMTSLDQDRLMKYIIDISKEKLSIAALRRRVKELGAGDLAGTDHTEIAQAVIEDFKKTTPLHFHTKHFWWFNGSHWQTLDDTEVLKHIAQEYGSLPAARKANDHSQIIRTIRTLVPQGIQSSQMMGVNFANGFLAHDGRLYPHDATYGCTHTLPFRYLPEDAGKCARFMDFLHDSWGHHGDYQDKVSALQEALCVTLFGMGPRFQRAILLKGPGKSGKSQLLTIVRNLVPLDGRCACPPDLWNDRFAPASMHRKVLNVCGELPEEANINGQRFKDIIAGDEIKMEYKGGQLFTGQVYATHWFASNYLPRTKDTSDGFNRRWLIFMFDKVIQDSERVMDFGETIAAEEREGIVAWAIEALPRLLTRNEYTLSKSHADAVAQMANINNSVRFFLDEADGLARTSDSKDQVSEFKLHQLYSTFCVTVAACQPYGLRQFRLKMKDLEKEFDFRLMQVINPETRSQECIYTGMKLVNSHKNR